MNWIQKIQSRFRALFGKRSLDLEMDEEMRSHVEMRIQENIALGMNANDAWSAAMREFGWTETLKETCREQRGVSWIERLGKDLQFALRMLQKNPGFTAVAIATLALCLGANLTIFAVIDSVLLRALPFPQSNRLVTMYDSFPNAGLVRAGASVTSYYERKGNIPAFSSLSGFSDTTTIVGETGSTERENVARVTSEFFDTLEVRPLMGRAFTEQEMTYQTDQVAILTDTYWRSHFNADPNILGKDIRSDGISRKIVGVLPRNFHFLSSKAQIFLPLSTEASERSIAARFSDDKVLIARLKPGATLVDAQTQIDAHNASISSQFPTPKEIAASGFHTIVAYLHADHVAIVRPTLLLLQAGALFLLLIGGVNLVNILLIRASGRSKEMAIRQSMGASRRHVFSQVMTETVLLGLLGGAAGVGVGALGIRLLMALGVSQLPLGSDVTFNDRLAMVAFLGAVAMGIFVALPITWFNLSRHLARSLQSESRGGTITHSAQRLRHGFIVTQIALAFVLLTGAGLLGLSLKRVMDVPPGFRPDHVLTGQFNLPWKGYRLQPVFVDFAERLLAEVGRQPGVSSVGLSTTLPLNGVGDTDAVSIIGRAPDPSGAVVLHNLFSVAGKYFTAMSIPLREGRLIDASDMHRTEPVCVVDQDFADHFWPKGSAVGQQFFQGVNHGKDDKPITIVGVVGSVKQEGLTDNTRNGTIYFPYSQFFSRNYFLVVRASLPPELLGPSLQRIVREIDPELPLNDIRSMDTRVSETLVTRRSSTLLTTIFASVALALAAIGTYGVISFSVTQRRREIAVRMALGAQRPQVLAQFLATGGKLLFVGIVIGVFGAWCVGRAMGSVLFGVGPIHLGVLMASVVVLIVVVLLAVLIPSRRAARVEPMEALRCE